MPEGPPITALHYVGYSEDRGGILSVVRGLAAAERFRCVLGVNADFRAGASAGLEALRLPRVDGEKIGFANVLPTWRAAHAVRAWLREAPERVFHGHSRAGLMVALWLHAWGERRVGVTVHCYGRQRWFYRWAARRLGDRLAWLSPAMKRYYGVTISADRPWAQCLPGCVAATPASGRALQKPGIVRLAGVGLLVRWKRWHLVLEALAALSPDQRKGFRFVHIGDVDGSADSIAYRQELRALTAQHGLGDVVAWNGPQPGSAGLLAASDCLVVASDGEPLSVAMLEALFAGVPVVAADSGGNVDVIAPPTNGWLFRSGDACDLAGVLQNLTRADAWDRVRIDERTLARFRADTAAVQHAALYERLIRP